MNVPSKVMDRIHCMPRAIRPHVLYAVSEYLVSSTYSDDMMPAEAKSEFEVMRSELDKIMRRRRWAAEYRRRKKEAMLAAQEQKEEKLGTEVQKEAKLASQEKNEAQSGSEVQKEAVSAHEESKTNEKEPENQTPSSDGPVSEEPKPVMNRRQRRELERRQRKQAKRDQRRTLMAAS